MKYFFLLFVSLFFTSCKLIHLKSALVNEKIGDAYLKTNQYAHAITYFLKTYKYNTNVLVAYKISNAYYLSRDFQNAELYLRPYQNDEFLDTNTIKLYANLNKCLGNYEVAKKFRNFYLSKTNNKKDNFITSCDSAIYWIKQPNNNCRIANMKTLNSSYSDISPAFIPNGLAFASSRIGVFIEKESGSTGEPYFDLYMSVLKNDSTFQNPSFFSTYINTPEHETAAFFDSTGTIIYYTKGETDTTNLLKIKILQSIKKGGVWSKPKQFVLNDSIASFGHPCMNKSETVFVFSSNLPGGYGGTDLYISFKKDNSWSVPENLGKSINTSGNEYYPFLTENGDIYFSSDGHIGMGGYDIYVAKFGLNGWDKIENLKSPINSCADDFSYILKNDKKIAYFSSNRVGGLGKEDIYKIMYLK